jgi:serine protease Do
MHAASILLASALLASAPDVRAAATPATPALPPAPAPASAPYCSGEYADDLLALSAQARLRDERQQPFTFCVRTTATYECPSYGEGGTLRKTRRNVVAHGTAFGLRQENGETLLVTNDHVSEWPEVTDEDHAVESVPAGCRRVSSAIRVVDDESDAYDRDDVAATRVVTDPELDVSVLRAKAALPTIPWKIGHSAGLRERNVVDVRGFPLGALRANNVGKVVSTNRHDEDNGWNHDDFVVDALLSPGNSGSPVLAVSCRTGEFELVGIYHARYTRGTALHTVVGVDQLQDLLATLKRSPRGHGDSPGLVARDVERARLTESARATGETYFPFGQFTAVVRARADGALLFELMSHEFPVQGHPALVLEDRPVPGGQRFGELGRVWAGNRQGLRDVTEGARGAELWPRVLEALRADALLALDYRAQARSGTASRAQFQETRRLERALRRTSTSHQDLAQAALDSAEQLFPRSADAELGFADVLRATSGPAPAPWSPPELAHYEAASASASSARSTAGAAGLATPAARSAR